MASVKADANDKRRMKFLPMIDAVFDRCRHASKRRRCADGKSGKTGFQSEIPRIIGE
jgi:hypothetical protein